MGEKREADYNLHGYGLDKRLVEGTCGHCGKAVVFKDPEAGPTSLHFQQTIVGSEDEADEIIEHYFVMGVFPNPRCQSATILYRVEAWEQHGNWSSEPHVGREEIIHPRGGTRRGLPEEVPAALRDLYEEAGRIEFLSPTATAFISRRILEQTLREQLGSKARLVKLIDSFLDTMGVPTELHELMHDVRGFGNIAGHPAQTSGGDWVVVDQVEATYILDVVKELLDFIHVRPARQRAMRARLEQKKRGEIPARDVRGDVVVGSVPKPPPSGPPLAEPDDDLPF